jgi:thiol-disulfide isomerase/thioredoxin
MRTFPFLLPLAVLAACNGPGEPAPGNGAAEIAAEAELEPAKGVSRARAGAAPPDLPLSGADGKPATLAEAAADGPVLVNLWATWCAPCVKELPTLQALSQRPGAPRVIAVSQDMAPRGSIEAFLNTNRLAGLEVWHDPEMNLSGALQAQILPTTILYDARGREVWRYTGDLDWTGPEAAALLAEAR